MAGSSSTQTAAAARRTDEPMVTASEPVTKEPPQKDLAPASVEPAANPVVTAQLTDTGGNPKGTTARVGTAAPAVQRSAAPVVRRVPQTITAPSQILAAVSKPSEFTAIIHHPVAASPKIYAAAADQPRVPISGRPQKLVYPVCPETRARGKVSLQAVVGYDGAVSRVRVLTGDRALAAAAVEAVRQWRYEPFPVPPCISNERPISPSLSSRTKSSPSASPAPPRFPDNQRRYSVRSHTSHTWQLLCMSPGSKPASRLLFILNPF